MALRGDLKTQEQRPEEVVMKSGAEALEPEELYLRYRGGCDAARSG